MYDWNIVDCAVKQPIHLTFTPQFLTKNLEAGLQQLSGFLSSTKMVIADTNFWF